MHNFRKWCIPMSQGRRYTILQSPSMEQQVIQFAADQIYPIGEYHGRPNYSTENKLHIILSSYTPQCKMLLSPRVERGEQPLLPWPPKELKSMQQIEVIESPVSERSYPRNYATWHLYKPKATPYSPPRTYRHQNFRGSRFYTIHTHNGATRVVISTFSF
jgi:hypothetical protein